MIGIYQITNTITNEMYVGSSVNIFQRMYQHQRLLERCAHHSQLLQKAWNKYGNVFEVSTIEQVNEPNFLLYKERFHIERLKPEYNIDQVHLRLLLKKRPNKKILKPKTPPEEVVYAKHKFQLLTVAEAAEQLGLKQRTVYELIKSGKLPGHKLGNRLRVRENGLQSFKELSIKQKEVIDVQREIEVLPAIVPIKSVKVSAEAVTETELFESFAEFLKIDVANGDAREDTIRSYKTNVAQWVEWCRENNIDPGRATQAHVKAYRQTLIQAGRAHGTIALKLTTIRRFYQGALDRGMIKVNPADGVRAPRERAAKETIKHLSAGEAEILFRVIPKNGKLKNRRDRAIIAMMALEGLRAVEIERANVTDVETMPDGGTRILVHGKGKDAYIYPREDTVEALNNYLAAREVAVADEKGAPMFTAVGNRSGGNRISRDGVREVVNFYLEKASLKKPGLSCHALRHTCGALLYQATRDVKVVQETLRHSDISTAARYSHIIQRGEARYTNQIPITI